MQTKWTESNKKYVLKLRANNNNQLEAGKQKSDILV